MLRYLNEDDMDDGFEIIAEKSGLSGIIAAADPCLVRWTMHMEWHNPDVETKDFRRAWAEIADLTFNERGWKDLVGRETHVNYESEDVRPVMPDNPANLFYCGQHDTPNDNRVKFISRNGPDFTIEWRATLEDTPNHPLHVMETVKFKEIFVFFEKAATVDMALARKLATGRVDSTDLGPPAVTGVNNNWVRFPITAAYETPQPPPLPKQRKKRPAESDPAVIAMTELGARVKRDHKMPSNPVVSIDIFPDPNAGQNAGDALALIKEIAEISHLHLGVEGATDQDLSHLAGLTQMWALAFSNSSICDNGLEHIQGLTGLVSLHITGSPLGDRALDYLQGMTNLETLDLYGTCLSDAGLKVVGSFVKLRRLTLAGQGITDAGLVHLRTLANLEYLALDHTKIQGEGLAHLQSLQKLKHLNISGESLTDSGLVWIAKLGQLHRLGLASTAVSDKGLPQLKVLKNLKYLGLQQTPATKEGAAALRKHLPKLEVMPWWYP